MEKNAKLTGEATAEQITTWKNQYKKVFQLTVAGCVGYIKKPGRKELSYASQAGANAPLVFAEAILTSCWIGGDETIKTDDEKFLGVSSQLEKIISVAEAEIKEL